MYKRSLKIFKYIFFITLMILVCTLLIFFASVSPDKREEIDSLLESTDSASFIKVTDNYDRKGHKSFFDLMEDKESFFRLKNMYYDLINSDTVDYYEFAVQPLEISGQYMYSDDFLYGDNISLKNQEISYANGTSIFITPVKSIQAGSRTFESLGLNQYIEDNIQLVEDDFTFEGDIPIILGSCYKEYHNAGDVIEGSFITKKMNFVVKGFFCENAAINFNNQIYDLNNIIFVPLMNIKEEGEEKDKDFQIILYSVKNSGYLSFKSADEYQKSTRELERLSKQNQLDYTIILNPVVLTGNANGIRDYINPYSFCLIVLFNLILLIILFSVKKDCYHVGSRHKIIIYFILIALLFAICLFFAYLLNIHYYKYTIYFALFLQKIKNVLVGVAINYLIVFLIFCIIKKFPLNRKRNEQY